MLQNLDHLKAAAIWVPVKIVPKGAHGKTDKIPVNAGGYQIDAQNPANLMSWWEAEVVAQAVAGPRGGIGVVLTGEHDLFCVDLDDCITTAGPQGEAQLSDLALGFIEALPGVLMERSHSGRGLHLWGTATIGDHRTRASHLPGLEVYTRGRFILVTGEFCGGWLDDHSATLGAMTTALLGPVDPVVPFEWSDTGSGDNLTDAEVIARVRAHRIHGTGRTGAALWDGDVDALSAAYPPSGKGDYDASGADLALATLLMQYTGNNAERSARLLTESGLARDKHGRDDYMRWTIERAYRPELRSAINPAALPWAGKRLDVPNAPCDNGSGAVAQRSGFTSGSDLQQSAGNATGGCKTESKQELAALSDSAGSIPACPPIPPPPVWRIPQWAPDAFLGAADMATHFAGCTYVSDRDQIYAPDGKFHNERQFNSMWGGNGLMFVMSSDNKVTKKAWEAFHGSSQFATPKVATSTFLPDKPPGEIVDGALNTWRHVHVRMLPGDPEPWLSLLRKQIPNERDQRILLSWMAACVQHREKKFRWSPYIQGLPGNGKTTHMSVIDYCVGAEYSCRPRSDMLGKQFNSMLDRKLFAGVDDVHVTMKMWAVLKPMITETVSEVERKGVDSTTVRGSVVKYMLTGNDKNGLPITRDNRRIAPFFTGHQELEDLERDGIDEEYLDRLYKWLGQDGYAIVAHYLMHYPIDPEFNPAEKCQRAPFTSSTDEAIRACRPEIERHVGDAVDISRELAADGTVTHLQMQMFYRKHGHKMPGITECTKLLRDFGFVWDKQVTWRRVPAPPAPEAASVPPRSASHQ